MVCGDHLVSIRQFGSVTDGQYKPGISDIDFIVVVTDDCAPETMDKLRSELAVLETKHNVAGLRQLTAVQRVIASRTALFKSHFVFHRPTLETQQYSRVIEEAAAFNLSGGLHLQSLLRIILPCRLDLLDVLAISHLIFVRSS